MAPRSLGPPKLNDVYPLDAGLKIARDHEEAGAWTPGGAEIRALPQTFSVQEESSGCSRVVLSGEGGRAEGLTT